ncbi:hypothetical protein Hanom_Chr01g00010521 [Helianthus anomalus]
MVKPDLDLWTGTDPIFRVVNRFCILCLIGSRVGSGNGRVGFLFLLTPSVEHVLKFGSLFTILLDEHECVEVICM